MRGAKRNSFPRLNLKKLLSTLPVLIAIALLYNGFHKTAPNSNAQTSNLPICEVKRKSVYDGDTLRVLCGGQEKKIRFACVDAPEVRPKQSGGIEARDQLRSLLSSSGNQVKVNLNQTP